MDIIIPVSTADATFVCQNVLSYIKCNIVNAENIYIITARPNFSLFGSLPAHCSLIDEDELLSGLTFSLVEQLLSARYGKGVIRTGWYMQQMLKLSFARSSYASRYYLSWDADTIPLQPIRMFAPDGRPFMTLKPEYHRPYFDTLHRLLSLDKAIPQSFIAEHVLFETQLVDKMLTEIEESTLEGDSWVAKIIAATDYEKSHSQMLFSEFETYGTWTHIHYPNHYVYRRLRTLRHGGFFCGRNVNHRLLSFLSRFKHTISFERYDKPHFPQILLNKLLGG